MRSLLRPEIQEFITANVGADLSRLALKRNPFPEVNWQDIIRQIAAKTKAGTKLPTWYHTHNILWPGRVSLEQTSSEVAARYKASLVSGESLIDVSGGFGIDDFYFAKKIKEVTHCEQEAELSFVVEHNYKQLQVSNIKCYSGNSSNFLKNSGKFDWIYADPARRHESKGKVFKLSDCEPNVPKMLPLYYQHTENLLVKTAPLLDISSGISELMGVKEIHIVAVANEVKELLWILKKDYKGKIDITAVNLLHNNTDTFTFTMGSEAFAEYGPPQTYLYEPNSAIMKSGGFDEVAQQFNLIKLHPNTHLYTSQHLINFPGRRFRIELMIPYSKTFLKQHVTGKKFNVTVRNFPESVEQIRKKWKIFDGGLHYCFVTTDTNENKIVLICSKID